MRELTFEHCDHCGPAVQAKVLVYNIPVVTQDSITGLENFGFHGELTLCGHCADVHEIAFVSAGYALHDTRLFLAGSTA